MADKTAIRDVNMVLTKFEVTERSVELRFEIRNGSDHDVWVCKDLYVGIAEGKRQVDGPRDSDTYFVEDTRTLMIRRRQYVPSTSDYFFPPEAQYVRIGPRQAYTETLSLTLPVRHYIILGGSEPLTGVVRAQRLVLEIGYHRGDLPQMVHAVLEEAERFSWDVADPNASMIAEHFPGLLVRCDIGGPSSFFERNKAYLDKGEVLIPYTRQALKGEQFVRVEVDGVSIPFTQE